MLGVADLGICFQSTLVNKSRGSCQMDFLCNELDKTQVVKLST